jgi:hypothetical protein
MYRNLAVLAVAAALFAAPGICKCRHRIIHVEGSIVSPATDGLSVKVEVTPDPNWEPQPEVSVKDGKFAGEVYFDATKSEGRVRDNCSRIPERVEVVMLKDGHEVDRVRLDVSKAFVKDELHNYKLRSPITLHSQ